MGLIDRIRRRPLVPDDGAPATAFAVELDEETRFVAAAGPLELMRAGTARRSAQEQFLVLDMLADEGRAVPMPDGFTMSAEDVARLADEDASVLGLPPRFRGEIRAKVHRWTESPDFRVDLELVAGPHPEPPTRRGPAVRVGGSWHLASVPLLRTLRALESHAALPRDARTEVENVRLVARLQAARRVAAAGTAELSDESFHLSLGALDRFETSSPASVGLIVESQPDGSLLVEPDLGPDLDREAVRRRWHQLDGSGESRDGGIIRVDDNLVMLEGTPLRAVREVRSRPRIPSDEARRFFDAPGSYYDPELVDVDIRFGVRVAGLGVIAPISFNEAASSGLDWFAKQTAIKEPETLAHAAKTSAEQEQIEGTVADARDRGESVVPVHDGLVDISDRSRVDDALAASRQRIAALSVDPPPASPAVPDPDARGRQVTVGMHIRDTGDLAEQLLARASAARPQRAVDYAGLRRDPYPHQRTGIEWMAGLMQAALAAPTSDPARIQGALLADDMGLGKTYMTLAALAEARRVTGGAGQAPLPTLAVMPVALLENWLQEIESTFGTKHGPFDDVVVLQGAGLDDYRMRGAARETAANLDDLDEHGMVRSDRIHASLRVGPRWKDARLDRPGVLVLTTYEALRRYQVSLGLVEWGVVIFDEAQATKNPEILATRAAKALQARFKLLATGTPVENSLRDFWSLVDTAQPGLLGTWAQFNTTWATPMKAASGAEHERLGRELRAAVGDFMLRRVKEDHLTDLPGKHTHEYRRDMPAVQVQAYDEALERHRLRGPSKGAALKALHELSAVSLHPGLLSGQVSTDAAAIAHSARTLATVAEVLDDVRARDEKAIVFAWTKELQRTLSLWLGERYGFRVAVVNGDTAATGTGETRMAKIRAFESSPGFNVIILSPLAVGVGLTVVGANHAVHLERHWNPAKEAQATDRIHRIGQKREVHIHYPLALHPQLDSFDLNLDRLLRSKVALKDAVVVPQEVTPGELERALGLSTTPS